MAKSLAPRSAGAPKIDRDALKAQAERTLPPTTLPQRQTAPTEEKTVQLSFRVPDAVAQQLAVRAAEERTSQKVLILRGLASLGFDVPADALENRRGRRS